MLPKIDTSHLVTTVTSGKKLPSSLITESIHSSQAPINPKLPLTLELQHAGQRHTVSLPTGSLDKNKKYYVTFTINSSDAKKIIAPGSESQQAQEITVS